MLGKLWSRAMWGATVITRKYSQWFRTTWELYFSRSVPTCPVQSEPAQPGQVLSGGYQQSTEVPQSHKTGWWNRSCPVLLCPACYCFIAQKESCLISSTWSKGTLTLFPNAIPFLQEWQVFNNEYIHNPQWLPILHDSSISAYPSMNWQFRDRR